MYRVYRSPLSKLLHKRGIIYIGLGGYISWGTYTKSVQLSSAYLIALLCLVLIFLIDLFQIYIRYRGYGLNRVSNRSAIQDDTEHESCILKLRELLALDFLDAKLLNKLYDDLENARGSRLSLACARVNYLHDKVFYKLCR